MTITNLSFLVRKSDLTIRKINKQFYLLTFKSCYEVNDLGAIIVNLVGSDMPIEILCKKISLKYDNDDCQQILHDIMSFLEFLINEELVVITDEQ